MELYSLEVFLTVVTERSFSRAAQKLYRTQPAISLALQRLEQEVGEKLIDRGSKDFTLTDAGRTVLEYARRFVNLQGELENSLAELRDKSAGRLTIGETVIAIDPALDDPVKVDSLATIAKPVRASKLLEDAVRQLRLVDRNDPVVTMVAKTIIELARRGERDPIRLRDQAIQSIR